MTSCASRLVVPEVGHGRLLLELRLLPAQLVEIEHGLDVAQGGVEGLELFGEIGSGHNSQDYRSAPAQVSGRAARRTHRRDRREVRPTDRSGRTRLGAALSQARAALW